MAVTLPQALAQATGGFRLAVSTAAERRALTQNVLSRAILDTTGAGTISQALSVFQRAGYGIRESDFAKIYRTVTGRQQLNKAQLDVLARQRETPLDALPPLRDIPTLRQAGVSQFVIRAQVEIRDTTTGRTSRAWITINTDTRMTAGDVKASIPDFGFESGSESLLERGEVVELQTFKRSPTTTAEI